MLENKSRFYVFTSLCFRHEVKTLKEKDRRRTGEGRSKGHELVLSLLSVAARVAQVGRCHCVCVWGVQCLFLLCAGGKVFSAGGGGLGWAMSVCVVCVCVSLFGVCLGCAVFSFVLRQDGHVFGGVRFGVFGMHSVFSRSLQGWTSPWRTECVWNVRVSFCLSSDGHNVIFVCRGGVPCLLFFCARMGKAVGDNVIFCATSDQPVEGNAILCVWNVGVLSLAAQRWANP